MKNPYLVGGVLLGAGVLIGVLLYSDFFELFVPDELTRWEETTPPSFLEPQVEAFSVEDIEDLAGLVDDRLAVLLKEGPAAYTAEQAEAWADELIPIIERICQRDFTWRPVIRLADRAEVAETIARRLYAHLEETAPGIAGPYLERQLASAAAFESVTYLGMYDPDDQILYLMPTNVRAIMQAAEIDERHFEPFVKLIVAHELVHALQFQVNDPVSVPQYARTPDGSVAYQSVIEGHAVFVTDLVGHELGIDETSREISIMLSAGAVTVEDPAFDRLWRAAEVLYEEIYLGGRDFIAYHHEQGAMDRVWRVLASPPASSAMITDPATYATTRRGTLRFFHALRGLETKLGPNWRRGGYASLSGLDLHSRFSLLDNEARDRVVAGIEVVWTMGMIERPGENNANLALIVLRREADIEPYYTTVRAFTDKFGGWMVSDQVENPAGIVADESRRHTVVPDTTVDGQVGYAHIHARRGRVIIDINCTDVAVRDAVIADLVNTIFERLESSGDEG